ncbi:hypothetical protein ACHAO8_001019 [Botrytis cinerea]
MAEKGTSVEIAPSLHTNHPATPPSEEIIPQKSKQSLSDKFTIFAAGAALVSDGYFNNIMTMSNVILKKQYPKEYTAATSTRVSNSLLVGEIFGQVTIGLTCDYFGRKFAIITTTLMIVFGGILATASKGVTIEGMFWMMTVARGIIGFGVGDVPAAVQKQKAAVGLESIFSIRSTKSTLFDISRDLKY